MSEPAPAAEALASVEQSPEPEPFELRIVPNRLYGAGRRCSEPGCITILCRFNAGPDCFMHQDQRLARQHQEAADARERAA